MSFDLSREAWSVPDLDAPARLVLLALADIANDAGECWPGVALLSDRTGLGERSIRARLKAFEERGLISRERRHRKDGSLGTYRYSLHLAAPHAGGLAAPGAAHEPISSEPTSSSSLRSEEGVPHQVARDYWDWYKIEHNGLRPTIDFLPLRGVVKRLLKSGHEPDAIIDAMKTSKAWTAKALSQEIARRRADIDRTAVGGAIPHAIVRAFAKAAPFFERHQIEREAVHYWMRRAGLAASGGYGPGETMIRVALAVRAENATTWALMDAQVPRFEGELDDYADAMERAWTNRRWSVR